VTLDEITDALRYSMSEARLSESTPASLNALTQAASQLARITGLDAPTKTESRVETVLPKLPSVEELLADVIEAPVSDDKVKT